MDQFEHSDSGFRPWVPGLRRAKQYPETEWSVFRPRIQQMIDGGVPYKRIVVLIKNDTEASAANFRPEVTQIERQIAEGKLVGRSGRPQLAQTQGHDLEIVVADDVVLSWQETPPQSLSMADYSRVPSLTASTTSNGAPEVATPEHETSNGPVFHVSDYGRQEALMEMDGPIIQPFEDMAWYPTQFCALELPPPEVEGSRGSDTFASVLDGREQSKMDYEFGDENLPCAEVADDGLRVEYESVISSGFGTMGVLGPRSKQPAETSVHVADFVAMASDPTRWLRYFDEDEQGFRQLRYHDLLDACMKARDRSGRKFLAVRKHVRSMFVIRARDLLSETSFRRFLEHLVLAKSKDATKKHRRTEEEFHNACNQAVLLFKQHGSYERIFKELLDLTPVSVEAFEH